MSAIDSAVVPLLNRLLSQEAWPRQRLSPFVGQSARIEGGPFRVALTIDQNGLFSVAAPDTPADVTISFASDAPFKLLSDPASAFAAARLTGAANFAETLAFVFRNLRWDYEGDLAGDIPARRLARFLADGVDRQRSAVRRLGANLSEYATEESGLLASSRDIAQFCTAVDLVRDDLARLEKRLTKLNA
jgi:ubiquinone biosynthesis accessory factor UbiJ